MSLSLYEVFRSNYVVVYSVYAIREAIQDIWKHAI